MKYCLIDEYNNLYSVDLKSPSQTIFWACVCLGVEYRGKTREIAEREMVRAVEKNTNYRGYAQIAKHLGVSVRSYGLMRESPKDKERLCCFVRDGGECGIFTGAGEN